MGKSAVRNAIDRPWTVMIHFWDTSAQQRSDRPMTWHEKAILDHLTFRKICSDALGVAWLHCTSGTTSAVDECRYPDLKTHPHEHPDLLIQLEQSPDL